MKTTITAMRYEDHKKLGDQLKQVRHRLTTLLVDDMKGLKFAHPVNKATEKALAAIDSLRCALDNQAFRDMPNLPDEQMLNIYYGRDDERTHN